MQKLVFELLFRDSTYMRAVAGGDNYVIFSVPDGAVNGFADRMTKRAFVFSASYSITHLSNQVTLRIERDGIIVIFLCGYPIIDETFEE